MPDRLKLQSIPEPGQKSDTSEPSCLEDLTNLSILDVLDAMPFYVLLIDEDHNILEANKAVHTHLGIRREDILGMYCPKAIHGQDQPFRGCPLEEAVQSNRAIERELFDEKTGRWVISAIYPTQARTRKCKKVYLHMVTDITERVQARQQLKESHTQLRRLSAYLESVREEEKRKIALDLHDQTSQVLASLYAYLEAAVETLPKDAEKSAQLLKKAQALSTTIQDDIHRLIYELRPAALDKLGLVAAINSLADSYLKVAGQHVYFRKSGRSRRLSPSLEIMLFRVVQEAFTNIVKHARAKNITLNIQFKKDRVTLYIKDDGIGFDYQAIIHGKTRGLGLVSMRERVAIANGSLTVNSSPGQGTEITIEVPTDMGVTNG
jgi:PAS domain S-box-containing protein